MQVKNDFFVAGMSVFGCANETQSFWIKLKHCEYGYVVDFPLSKEDFYKINSAQKVSIEFKVIE